jgi:regulator of replication initiation timing
MVKPASSLSIESIDRLSEKVQSLIGVLKRTRTELTRATEDNARLSQELDLLKPRLENAEDQGAQAQDLLNERDQIRTRVSEMLAQLDELSL